MIDIFSELTALPRNQSYSKEFTESKGKHRHLMHDILHLTKSVGLLARAAEHIDHDEPVSRYEIRKALADLIIVTTWAARDFPGGPLDLHQIIEDRIAVIWGNGKPINEPIGRGPGGGQDG